jgi:hypothetical protein
MTTSTSGAMCFWFSKRPGQAQHNLTLDGLVVLARQMGALSEFENVEGDHG